MLRTTYLHSGWEFIQTDRIDQRVGVSRADWMPATVPGHVHLDLVANGVIAHPFERMNELGCQWVDEKNWSYRTTFEWAPNEALPHRVLRFEGLDTVCTITLNGEQIAKCDNMFLPVEIDVAAKLKAGANEIRIDFASAIRVGLERQHAYFEAEGIPQEKDRCFTERAFVRKAQYMYGWDWGPRLVSCGVWKPVKLIEYANRLTDVAVHQEWLESGDCKVTVESTVEGEGHLFHSVVDPEGGLVCSFEGDGSFIVPNPTLWRPQDDVPQTYRLVTHLMDSEEDESEVYDGMVTTIGFKQFELVREPDQFGESFEFRLNGEPFWARGANWIPDHSFPSATDKNRLRDLLEKAKDMGVNMLRVWGGGLYESDAFYDLCDELGILVWQDFTFACGFYPDTAEYVEPFRAEAEANVRRLRNHPSLAIWCGNNENHQCYGERWAREFTPDRFYGEHFYHGVIPETLQKLDPSRPYTPGSACGPKDDPLAHVNEGGYGDSHYWDVWHGRGDWRFYADSTSRFSSEFGFVSSCALSTWDKWIDEEDWDAFSPVVKWHDKTGKGYENYVGYVTLHYPRPTSLEEWVYFSQLNQRDGLRFGIEHFRRSEFCKGTLIWQINDCWPVQSWAFLDSEGQYKALGYELRRLYADLLLSIKRDQEAIEVWAINDTGEDEAFNVTLTVYSTLDGTQVGEWQGSVDVPKHARKVALDASVLGLNVNETILVAESEYGFAWQLLGEPKNTRFGAPCDLLISTSEDGVLRIQADGPIVDLMLTANGAPEPFLDNFITAPQGGTFDVAVAAVPDVVEARSLAGQHLIRVTRSPI